MPYGHRVRKDDCVWNDDFSAFLSHHNGRTGLDIGNLSLNSGNTDEITQSERLLQQQQDSRKEVLQDILEGEPYGNGTDTQYLDQVRGLK